MIKLKQILVGYEYAQEISDVLKIYIPIVKNLPDLRKNPKFMSEHVKATTDTGVTDVATEADLFIEQTLRTHFEQKYPTWGFWGEEGAKSQNSKWLVVVDPIEGTNNFKTYRDNQWGSVIALIKDGVPIFGAVAVPAQKRLLVGFRGYGAFEAKLNGTDDIDNLNYIEMSMQPENPVFTYNFSPHFNKKIRSSAESFKQLGLVVGRQEGEDEIAKLRETLEIDGNIFTDPESGVLETIFNRGTIYFKTSAEMAATFVIIEELGGKVTTIDGSGWSIDIDTLISARSDEDHKYLVSLVEKSTEGSQ